MKRRIAAIAGVFGLLLACAGFGLAHAQNFSNTTLANQTVDSSLYSTGREVDVQGTINGDVYCGGQNITINATVHGDVLCAGENIVINGHVDGSVRAVGLDITLNASVGHSASLAGDTIAVGSTAAIHDDFTAAGSKAVVRGAIGRDATFGTKTTQLFSTIGRNAELNGTTLTLENNAHVHGSLTYTSANMLKVGINAHVDGKTTHKLSPTRHSHIAVFGLFSLLAFPMILLFLMLAVLIFPRLVHDVAEIPREHFFRSMMVGFATLVAMPVLLFVLVLSLVGIVTAIVLVVLWALLALASAPVVSFYVGRRLLPKAKSALTVMLVGSIVVLILYLVPVLGVMTGMLSYMIGGGAIVLHVKRHLRKPNYSLPHHR